VITAVPQDQRKELAAARAELIAEAQTGKEHLEVADIGFGCVPDADRVEISD
jgi:hypothetical protein